MNKAPLTLLSLAAVLAGTSVASGQENLGMGKMWTFENPPLDYFEQEYGFRPDETWLNQMRLASLRFGGGCSASFVSPNGLILTNHHCVRDFIAQVQGQDDWVANGFFAASPADEVPVPGLIVEQLVSMTDVTARMNEGIEATDSEADTAAKLQTNRQAILSAAQQEQPDLKAQVVTLFQGAVYQLYQYKVYDDIRLVLAPHLQIAHYGGDPDNFTYPRYSIDFSFCRAYENDQPVDTAGNYFRWSEPGPQPGELVIVPGNPGSTNRLTTVAQLQYFRDAQYPIILGLIRGQLEALRNFAAQDPSIERQLRTSILGLENSDKAYTGYLGGLQDAELMAAKAAAESEFRQVIDADPELSERFGEVWDQLEQVAAQRLEMEPGMAFHTPLLNNGPLARALLVVEANDPDTDAQRRSDIDRQIAMSGTPINPIQEAVYVDHLRRSMEWLDDDDPVIAAMGANDPAEILGRLRSSKIADSDFVDQLLTGGMDAINASDDPAVSVARAMWPLIKQHRELDAQLSDREEVLGKLLGQALFAVYGNKVSPDATFTPRFSDGIVTGYPYNGTIAPWRTSFYGLYGRNVEFDNQFPFDLPQVWLERKDAIDLARGVDFVSTNDLIGGNSGSPVVNKDLEVVGLCFDGNIEMLPNNFLYRDEVPRCVAVHVHGIMESMVKIYEADRIVDEVLGR